MRPLILKVLDIVRVWEVRKYHRWLCGDHMREDLFDIAYDGICLERVVLIAHLIVKHIPSPPSYNYMDDYRIVGREEVKQLVLGKNRVSCAGVYASVVGILWGVYHR